MKKKEKLILLRFSLMYLPTYLFIKKIVFNIEINIANKKKLMILILYSMGKF